MAFKMKYNKKSAFPFKDSPMKDSGADHFADVKDEISSSTGKPVFSPKQFSRKVRNHDKLYGAGHPTSDHEDAPINETPEERDERLGRTEEMEMGMEETTPLEMKSPKTK